MIKQRNKNWWKKATIYQIYPKSFYDSRGAGTGDIGGITRKLDYLKTLGIDAIWLTPVYCSPMIDNGYDISDYYSIKPDFGTMADFEAFLEAAHRRDIAVIMDIVVNHTSTQHPWFQDALGNQDSPYRDYYIWRKPVNGNAPNNWQSKFGGSAWAFDDATEEYYLHLFAKEQADLNWENPEVREEVKNIIRFWAEKGVDGFRLDVINLISKDQHFPDDESGDGRCFYTDGPKVHEYLQEISDTVFRQYGSVTVGEMSSTTLEHCQQYSSPDGRELSMVFNFHHLKVDYPDGEKWALAPFDFLKLKQIFNYWQTNLNGKGWGALFWCNHDQPRVVSRLGNDTEYRVESAKMLAAALHMMQGTPYIYQGEEIGMTNPHFTQLSEYRDVESTNMYDIMVNHGGVSEPEMMSILAERSRDNARTPMQWNAGEHAGFSSALPWIHVAGNYREINVENALQNEHSVFYFYQKLIRMRKEIEVITTGDYFDLFPGHPDILGYQRTGLAQQLICLNNFYGRPAECVLPESVALTNARYVLGNYPGIEQSDVERVQSLRPYETRVILVERHTD